MTLNPSCSKEQPEILQGLEDDPEMKVLFFIPDVRIISLNHYWEEFEIPKEFYIIYSPKFAMYRVRSSNKKISFMIAGEDLPSFQFILGSKESLEFGIVEESIILSYHKDYSDYSKNCNDMFSSHNFSVSRIGQDTTYPKMKCLRCQGLSSQYQLNCFVQYFLCHKCAAGKSLDEIKKLLNVRKYNWVFTHSINMSGIGPIFEGYYAYTSLSQKVNENGN